MIRTTLNLYFVEAKRGSEFILTDYARYFTYPWRCGTRDR